MKKVDVAYETTVLVAFKPQFVIVRLCYRPFSNGIRKLQDLTVDSTVPYVAKILVFAPILSQKYLMNGPMI